MDCLSKVALQQAIDYYTIIVDTDISKVDNAGRSKERSERLMRSYARLIGSQTNLRAIGKDMETNETHTLSNETIASYISAFKKYL